jgi:hypothetical protein
MLFEIIFICENEFSHLKLISPSDHLRWPKQHQREKGLRQKKAIKDGRKEWPSEMAVKRVERVKKGEER